MIVTRLKLANLRAIETAEFRFQPGFNLIVGRRPEPQPSDSQEQSEGRPRCCS